MRIKHPFPLQFDFTFCSKVINHLHRQHPTHHPEVDMQLVNESFKAALYILDCEAHNSQEFQVQLSKDLKSALSHVKQLTALAHQLRQFTISTNDMDHSTCSIVDNFQQNIDVSLMYNLQLEIVLCQNFKLECTFCSSMNRFHRNCSTASLCVDARYISQNANCHNILW